MIFPCILFLNLFQIFFQGATLEVVNVSEASERSFTEPVVAPEILDASRVVKPCVIVKSPIHTGFDSGAAVKDIGLSLHNPWPFDDWIAGAPDLEELSVFKKWIAQGAYKRKK